MKAMSKHQPIKGAEEWYVWSIRPGKFPLVERYLLDKVPGVKKILHPSVTTEKTNKRGGVKKKHSPLYAGYLFLQYEHDQSNPVTWLKINSYPFVTSYVGPCTERDLASVSNLQKTEAPIAEEARTFHEGDMVKARNGAFAGYTGRVNKKVIGNFISVQLEQAGGILSVVFSPEDLDILEKGSSGKKG